MRILLTNDDGIVAPGLRAMYTELAEMGDVDVVAPDSVQSASAHGITINAPLTARRVHVHHEFHGWSVAGRPADCVKLAIAELVERMPDLVVSGINDGANAGINVLYSGTVAAAAEGALLGFPAIAVSLERGEELDFEQAAKLARRVVEDALANGLGKGQLLNVNIPNFGRVAPKGVKVAPQSVQRMKDFYVKRDGPDGLIEHFLEGDFEEIDHANEPDLAALHAGYVAITPLHFDLTHREELAWMQSWNWERAGG